MARQKVRVPAGSRKIPATTQKTPEFSHFDFSAIAYIRTLTRRQVRKIYPNAHLPRQLKGATNERFYATCRAENSFPLGITDNVERACGYALEDDREVVYAH